MRAMERPETNETESDSSPTVPSAFAALSQLQILSTLPTEFVSALAKEARIFATYRGQTIIEEGEAAREVFFLITGKVSVQIESIAPNVEIGINRINMGEIFGEMALLGEGVRSATIVAREVCVLVSIPIERVEALCAAQPDVGMLFFKAIAGTLADRVREMNHKVLNMMRARFR